MSWQKSLQLLKNTNITPITLTNIAGIDKKLLQYDNLATSSQSISIGSKFKTYKKIKKKRYFAEIPIRMTDSCEATTKEVQCRAREGFDILKLVASSDEEKSEESIKNVLVEMMKQRPDIFRKASEEAGILSNNMITPDAAVNLQSLLRLPDNRMRDLRLILKNAGAHVLPSARQMKKVKDEKASHVSSSNIEMYLKRTQKEEKLTACPFVRVKDLPKFILQTCDKGELRDDFGFNHMIWLLFSGDKGGTSMKFVFSVINDIKNGSVDNNHIYAMYKASDSLENMWKIFSPFIPQIKEITKDTFNINGKKLKIFLGGDYHFLDDMLGHGGSSSSYPSSADFVSLEHLQNHGTKKHSVEDCGIIFRTVEWYNTYYTENVLDNRNKGNMRATAKHHYSVIEKMLFPILDLILVVPAVLHIVLGITLRLYDLVENECKTLDGICKTVEDINRKNDLNQQWKEKTLEMAEKNMELKQSCEMIIECENNLSRFTAVMKGDKKENEAIAKATNRKPRKGKKKTFEGKCNSFVCCMTVYDETPLWVTCDLCNDTYHTFCEGHSVTEEIEIKQRETYSCLKCTGEVKSANDIIEHISLKASAELSREDNLKLAKVNLSIELDKLENDVCYFMGPRETKLNNFLNEINVIRQAYHGHIMVGNHCIKVLEHRNEICDFIEGSEMKEKLLHLFTIFAELQPLLYANRFLSDQDVKKICSLCDDFGTYFPKYLPDINIFRKVHELVINVPRFVKEHRTIGMLSEQSSESLHAAVKMEARSLVSVKSASEQLRLQLVRQELRSYADKNFLRRESRLCKNTHANKKRSFLRIGNDFKKHCPICEEEMFNKN